MEVNNRLFVLPEINKKKIVKNTPDLWEYPCNLPKVLQLLGYILTLGKIDAQNRFPALNCGS